MQGCTGGEDVKYRAQIRRLEALAALHDSDKPLIVEGFTEAGEFICRVTEGMQLRLNAGELSAWGALLMFATGEVYEQYQTLKGDAPCGHTTEIVDDVPETAAV